MRINLRRSDNFVSNRTNVRWDGWTMVFFTPDERARSHVRGRYHEGRWGFETRIGPDHRGFWNVPPKLAGISN